MPASQLAKLLVVAVAIMLSVGLSSVRCGEPASAQVESGSFDELAFERIVEQAIEDPLDSAQDDLFFNGSKIAIATDQSLESIRPSFFQTQPALTPAPSAPQAPALPNSAEFITANLFGTFGVPRSQLASDQMVLPASASIVSGLESHVRLTTDAGNLLDKSPAALQIGTQRRNPVVADPRVRGSRVGSLAASGSHWVPARIDLDTALSKLDSRNINQIAVIPGPYSALYGPGLQFIDTDLKHTARYGAINENYGSSIAEFNSNGDRWHTRQIFHGGNEAWGYRGGYGHRAGSDYTTGTGSRVPSRYKSRDAHLAMGGRLGDAGDVEFQYLRLDQTDVELPGQAFDIDFLATDAYEVTANFEQRDWCDELEIHSWYNDTRLKGSAQRAGKRETFPVYDNISFTGFTNVNSSSAGYSATATWGDRARGEASVMAGADLRHVQQELNELTSSNLSGNSVVNAPIPRSHQITPGLFIELSSDQDSIISGRAGGRVDWVNSNLEEDPNGAVPLPIGAFTAQEILGSGEFDQHELLGLGFLSLECSLPNDWSTGLSVGYGERAANITERYAISPFMFLLQNGLNTVTGDPELDKERRIQCDWRIGFARERFRSEVTFFHAWSFDHITFENFNTQPLGGGDNQVQLKYVNTELAVLRGIESRSEFDCTDQLTAFATIKYVEGEDRTRNGTFATAPADVFSGPSMRFPGLDRGAFSGVTGAASEPLPGILPLEARIGLRVEEDIDLPRWGIELSARLVDDQDRVATSLLESPTPGFATGDLRGYWRVSEGIFLAAGVENFTNTRYREHLDFRSSNQAIQILQPGASFYCSTEFNY